jgi:predicted flap endonuclease-1-like 5' DNA nuclease
MTPIEDRLLGFVLGLLAGWLAHWLWLRWSHRPAVARRSEPVMAAPATPVAVPVAELSPSEVISHARPVDVSAARASGFNMKHADDLTIIEGIGPKIDELLRANGIDTFVQLAGMHVEDLLVVLERGGPSFRLANPATWAEQARLASENRWAELKLLQREMMGGTLPPEAGV